MSNSQVVSEAVFVNVIKNKYVGMSFKSHLYNSIKILSLGRENLTDGPDFLDAKVQFDDKVEYGDIEIHINSSSWYSHNHHTDEKYKNTILNLCLKDDSQEGYNIYSNDKIVPIAYIDGDMISSLMKEAKMNIVSNKNIHVPGLCVPFIKNSCIEHHLRHFGMERFNAKIRKFKNFIQNYGLAEAFYILLLESLGYVHNTEGFIKVANEIKFSYLRELYKNDAIKGPDNVYNLYLKAIEKLKKLHGSKLWNRKSIFPKSSPVIRLKQISPFIYLLLDRKIELFLKKMYFMYKNNELEKFLQKYIKSQFVVRNIIFNVILPFMKISVEEFSNNDIYEYTALPTNYLTRQALKRMSVEDKKNILKKEIHQQGIMYLSRNYCAYGLKGCEWCPLYLEYIT